MQSNSQSQSFSEWWLAESAGCQDRWLDQPSSYSCRMSLKAFRKDCQVRSSASSSSSLSSSCLTVPGKSRSISRKHSISSSSADKTHHISFCVDVETRKTPSPVHPYNGGPGNPPITFAITVAYPQTSAATSLWS